MAEAKSDAGVLKLAYKDFTDKKMLGEGSFNQVYVATHPMLGRCIVKIVSRSFYGKDKHKRKLEAEAKDIFSITNEHLIRGLAIVIEPEHLCMVYEYAEYGSLTDAIRRIPIAWPLKIRIAYETCLALSFLHNRSPSVFHGNLKTSNILLTKDFTAKVSDFVYPKRITWMTQATHQKDITDRRRMANGEPLIRKGSLLAHIPPETVRNIHVRPDAPYDVYSFAVMLWEMMTLKHPFPDETTNQVFEKLTAGYVLPYDDINPTRPQLFFEIMDKAFNSQPESRPKLSEIQSQLERELSHHKDAALSASIECQQAYERYRVMKREAQAKKEVEDARKAEEKRGVTERLLNQNRTFIDSIAPQPERPSVSGQICNTSAQISGNQPSTSRPKQARLPSELTKTTAVSMQPQDDDEEESLVPEYPPSISRHLSEQSTPRPVLHSQSSSSSIPSGETKPYSHYEEAGKSEGNEAFPIPPSEVQAMASGHGQPRPTIVNTHIHAANVQLQVGDSNMIGNQDTFSPNHDMPTSPINPMDITIPARYSQRIMMQADKYVVCDCIGKDWKRLARYMGFTKGQLDVIDHDYEKDGLTEKIFQLITKWESLCGGQGQVTIQNLVDVLVMAQLHFVAQRLQP